MNRNWVSAQQQNAVFPNRRYPKMRTFLTAGTTTSCNRKLIENGSLHSQQMGLALQDGTLPIRQYPKTGCCLTSNWSSTPRQWDLSNPKMGFAIRRYLKMGPTQLIFSRWFGYGFFKLTRRCHEPGCKFSASRLVGGRGYVTWKKQDNEHSLPAIDGSGAHFTTRFQRVPRIPSLKRFPFPRCSGNKFPLRGFIFFRKKLATPGQHFLCAPIRFFSSTVKALL